MKGKTTQEVVLVRNNRFDDVKIPKMLELYWPESYDERRVRAWKEMSRSKTFRSMAVFALTIVLCVTSVGTTYGKVGDTGSYFNDMEGSSQNVFFAELLDFMVADAMQEQIIVPMGEAVTIPITVTTDAGSVPTTYRVSIEKTAGNTHLCTALVADVISPFVYSGPLMSMNEVASAIQDISVKITLPNDQLGLPEGTPCTFDIVFKGWNSLVPESTGYTDEERVSVNLIDPPPPATDLGALTQTVAIVVSPQVDTLSEIPLTELIVVEFSSETELSGVPTNESDDAGLVPPLEIIVESPPEVVPVVDTMATEGNVIVTE